MAEDQKILAGSGHRLVKLAIEYLTEQVEARANSRTWGDVTVKLVFKDGKLTELLLDEHASVRPGDTSGNTNS